MKTIRESWKIADAIANYSLAIRCQRERGVRRGELRPHPGDETEARWAAEGETGRLDTVKDWTP